MKFLESYKHIDLPIKLVQDNEDESLLRLFYKDKFVGMLSMVDILELVEANNEM